MPRPAATVRVASELPLLSASLADRRLGFGLAAYFDKLDVSESLGHELAGVCMADPALLAPPSTALAGRLPFRHLVADPFDPKCRAVIPAITTLTIRLRRYHAEPSFLLHWRDPAKVATAGGLLRRRARGRVSAVERGVVGPALADEYAPDRAARLAAVFGSEVRAWSQVFELTSLRLIWRAALAAEAGARANAAMWAARAAREPVGGAPVQSWAAGRVGAPRPVALTSTAAASSAGGGR